jgi:hypothetical protein
MRLMTKSLRKKTKQTLCFYCMVTAQWLATPARLNPKSEIKMAGLC